MLDFLSHMSDVTGILGFILSIILLWRSESLRKTIILQKQSYNRKHSAVRAKLMAMNESLQEDDPITIKQISKIRQELHNCFLSYQYVLSFKDRCIVKRTLRMLERIPASEKKSKIISNLDYLIARLDQKEES